MKPTSNKQRKRFALAALVGLGWVISPTSASAQFSGGTYGFREAGGIKSAADDIQFHIKTAPDSPFMAEVLEGPIDEIAPVFASYTGRAIGIVPVGPGSSDALVGSDAADSIIAKSAHQSAVPSGPGLTAPIIIKSNTNGSPVQFDTDAGPRYIKPTAPGLGNALVGSDAADSISTKGAPHRILPTQTEAPFIPLIRPNANEGPANFDGGDGPDYVAMMNAQNAANFDGGDGPDYVAMMNAQNAANFDGGDGPDYIAMMNAQNAANFDGGDGPDYIAMMNAQNAANFDGGDGPDYVAMMNTQNAANFDGGDGPDYITMMNAQNAADFDGGDGPDYIAMMNAQNASNFDGGDGPDYVAMMNAQNAANFDGGDGPDYIAMMNAQNAANFDGGDGPDYVAMMNAQNAANFDGGDGPDYVAMMNAQNAADFDGGDGPDYVAMMNAQNASNFDGGDGPDYVAMMNAQNAADFDGGDGPDYIAMMNAQNAANFDGGDGPDYVAMMNAQNAADFDGGDGPDYVAMMNAQQSGGINNPAPATATHLGLQDALVGSDAADSLDDDAQKLADAENERSEIDQITTDIQQLVDFALDTLSTGDSTQEFGDDANETIFSEGAEDSLQATGNEVAIAEKLNHRSVSQRWEEWILMGETDDIADLFTLAAELDLLFWELEAGLVCHDHFSAELESMIEGAMLLRGILPETVNIELK